jgi:hypothetical protein
MEIHMRAMKIREYLRSVPFRPFRVFLSDGSSYEVPHPEFAWITTNHFFIATGVDAEGLPTREVTCDMLHVTRIEREPDGGPV